MKQWKKEITIKNKEAKIRYIACLAGSVLCLALASYILAGLIVNKQAKTAFEAGQYDEALEKYSSLEEWYLPGKMITKFNQGNCYYGQGEYKKAEAAYREALGYNHMRGEECPSRVNLTLTLLQQVDYEAIETAGDTREDEIIKIKAARKVLCEEGCADAKAGAGGHDEKAVALRNEIDKYLEEQGEKSEEENEDPQEEEENQNQNNSSSSSESNLKDQLDQQKKDAKEERQDTQDQIDNYNKSQEKEKDQQSSGGDQEDQEDQNGGGSGGDQEDQNSGGSGGDQEDQNGGGNSGGDQEDQGDDQNSGGNSGGDQENQGDQGDDQNGGTGGDDSGDGEPEEDPPYMRKNW